MTSPEGGRLTATGRRSALAAALPLLVTYFAGAHTWDLEVSPQLAAGPDVADPDLDDFAAATRLRASLAAATRLVGVVSRIIAQPTFRYVHVAAESVGSIKGRLDLARYGRQRGRIDVPRRYPIRHVERASATAENVLTTYAVQWIVRDLERTPTRLLPPGSPELRELHRLVGACRQLLAVPLLSHTAFQASDVWRQSSLEALVDRVEQRLEAGHIARPEPYRELAEWIRAAMDGAPVAELGDRHWSFYDERFDPKLFEIWCLGMLADALTRRLGAPAARPASLAVRARRPIFTWTVGETVVRLHFQPSLTTLASAGPRWHYDRGAPLMGFPDLAVTATTPTGRAVALFDPKLRQRAGAPTEEIYKLLGYFANLAHPDPPHGAIVYYSPGAPTAYTLRTADGGLLHALGVDPSARHDDSFDVAAELAVRVSGLRDTALRLF